MGSIHFGVFTSGERPTSGCSLFAVITPSFLRLGSFVCFLFILLIASPTLVLGQIRKAGPLEVKRQVVDFQVFPKKIFKPGETIRFVYRIYSDTLSPVKFDSVKIKFKITPFSQTNYPSLDYSSFQNLGAYILKANTGQRIPIPTPPERDATTVTYSIGDITRYPWPTNTSRTTLADTVEIQFTFNAGAIPDTSDCGRLTGFLSAEISQKVPLGGDTFVDEDFAIFKVDFESDIKWKFQISKTDFNQKDIVDVTITYRNLGSVIDEGTFSIFPPGTSFRSCRILSIEQQPPGFTINIIQADRCPIIIQDPVIPADSTVIREITVKIEFDICELSADTTRTLFMVELQAPCDARARNGDTKYREVNVALKNLLAVQASIEPQEVAPGDIINFTITLTRFDEPLDSVLVTVHFDPGIKDILEPSRKWRDIKRDINADIRTVTWVLENFVEPSRQITFKAVLRPDYYFTVPGVKDKASCIGTDFLSLVEASLLGSACPEGLTGDNKHVVLTKIKPLGDLLSIEVPDLPNRVLPGDILTFFVRYANVNAFSPSGLFTVSDTLPSRDYISEPTILYPDSGAVYDPRHNVIRLDSLTLAHGDSGSLVFTVSVREDFFPPCRDVLIINDAVLTLLTGVDCDTSNNQSSQTLIIANPQTSLSLKVDIVDIPPPDADPNEVVDLFIIYGGDSTSLIPIKNITVVDTLDAGMKFISSDPPPDSPAEQILIWSRLGPLVPGQRDTIKLRVQLFALVPCQTDTLFTHAGIFSSPAACSLPPPASDSIVLRGTDDLIDLRVVTSPPESTPVNASNEDVIEYRFTIINNSQFLAEDLVVTDSVPPADKFRVTEISLGGLFDPVAGTIIWKIPQLNVGDSTVIWFKGNLINRLYCALDSLVNMVSLMTTRFSDCPESHRTVHQISPTPPYLQRPLVLVNWQLTETRKNGFVEPNECVKLCLSFTSDTTHSNIVFNTDSLFAYVGNDTVPVRPDPNNPSSLAGGDAAVFCFDFQAPANISGDSLFVKGLVTSNLNCGQEIGPISTAAKGSAILMLSVVIEDASGDDCAVENELLTAKVTLQHAPGSRFAADSIMLRLNIGILPGTARCVFESSGEPCREIIIVVPYLPVGESYTWPVPFRYLDIKLNQQTISAAATYTIKGFDSNCKFVDLTSPEARDEIPICHPCFAKPRTFIPAVHPNGLQFEPDDNLEVFILDVDGSKIWEGRTSQAWDGRNKNGRPVPPGTYIYVIEHQCKGTILLLR